VGGNLVNASSIGDLAVFFSAGCTISLAVRLANAHRPVTKQIDLTPREALIKSFDKLRMTIK